MFNNYYTPTSLKGSFDLFHRLTKRLRFPKKEKLSFHDEITKNKDSLFNIYIEHPCFKSIIPKLFTSDRGVPFYNNIFKNALKKRNFLTNIIEQIKSKKDKQTILNENQPLTQRKQKNYELEDLEIMKKRKLKFENRLKLYPKPLLKKNNSFLIKSSKINNPFNQMQAKTNSVNSSATIRLHRIKIKPLDNINKNFNSFTMTSKENRWKNLNKLLQKCKLEINKGKKLEKEYEKFINNIHNQKSRVVKEEDNKKNSIIEVLEEGKKMNIDEGEFLEKYKELEKLKVIELKNGLNIKISDSLAYSIRKECNQKVKVQVPIKAYELYLEELNSLNKENQIKQIIEKKEIEKIKFLLDDFKIGKELLKQKLNRIKERNKEYKNIKEVEYNGIDSKDYEVDSLFAKKFQKIKSFLKEDDSKSLLSKLKST